MEKQECLLLDEESTAVNNLTQHVPSQELLLENDQPPLFQKIEVMFDAPPLLPLTERPHPVFDWSNEANHLYFTHDSDEQMTQEVHHSARLMATKTSSSSLIPIKTNRYSSLIVQLQKALQIIRSRRKKVVHENVKSINDTEIKISLSGKNKQMNSVCFKGLATPRKHTRKISLDSTCDKTLKYGKPSRSHDKQYETMSEVENKPSIKTKYKTEFVIIEQKESEIKEKKQIQQPHRERFLTSVAQWQEKRERKGQPRGRQEDTQTLTFTPTINLKSREIMRKKGKLAPIYQRDCKGKVMFMTQSTKFRGAQLAKQ